MDRYTKIKLALGVELFDTVRKTKVLVIGAGGIGCELLKNLALTGFKEVETIDLDTIDVSNLNRQFLFRKHHVGKPKAEVARDSAMIFNPECKITAHYGNVKAETFGFEYFKKFDIVLNALDNVNARQHVNRMCLGADIPMIDAGTTGYLGQVTMVQKGETQCYDCEPKSENRKVYPICTIRNTPEKPVHCIVWGKELFKLLFGRMEDSMLSSAVETDQAQDGVGEGGEVNDSNEQATDTEAVRKNEELRSMIMLAAKRPVSEEDRTSESKLREYAIGVFNAVFENEIKLKLSMKDGYKGAKVKPVPISFETTQTDPKFANDSRTDAAMEDQIVWSLKRSAATLVDCITKFWLTRSDNIGTAEFEKDEPLDLDFVTAASNVRSYIFGIEQSSKFDVKGIAGNIIHAIATTNAIVAGIQVMETVKYLRRKLELSTTQAVEGEQKLRTSENRFSWVTRHPVGSGYLIQPTKLPKPNPNCYSCGNAMLTVTIDTKESTFGFFVNKVLKGKLGVNAPGVTLGSSEIYLEGDGLDEEEVEFFANNLPKTLANCPGGGIVAGSQVEVEDFTQNLNMTLLIQHKDNKTFEEEENADLFAVQGEAKAKPDTENATRETNTESNDGGDDDDILVIDEAATKKSEGKRPLESDDATDAKRPCVAPVDDQDIVVLD